MSGCRPGDCDPETCLGKQGVFDDRRGREFRDIGVATADLGTPPSPRSSGLVEHHAFNRTIRETFAEATEISDARAAEYGDTWDVERMREGLLAQTLALPQPPRLRKEFIRLMRCAAIIDIKVSRLAGPWKPDTLTDLVNYQAAYLQWRAEYALAAPDTAPA